MPRKRKKPWILCAVASSVSPVNGRDFAAREIQASSAAYGRGVTASVRIFAFCVVWARNNFPARAHNNPGGDYEKERHEERKTAETASARGRRSERKRSVGRAQRPERFMDGRARQSARPSRTGRRRPVSRRTSAIRTQKLVVALTTNFSFAELLSAGLTAKRRADCCCTSRHAVIQTKVV